MAEKFSVKARIKSFSYAFKGLLSLFKTEHNAWIHLFAACVVIALGAFLGLSKTEWALVIVLIAIVIMAELLNTAIEKLCDIVQPEHDERIAKVKDYAAGAVLIVSIAAAIVGLMIFVPKIL